MMPNAKDEAYYSLAEQGNHRPTPEELDMEAQRLAKKPKRIPRLGEPGMAFKDNTGYYDW